MRRAVLSTLLMTLLSTIAAAVPDVAAAGRASCPTQPSNIFEYVDFAGPWERHGMTLEVGRLGCGELTWRTYRWCSPGRSRDCDRMQDGAVRFGGVAEFALRTPQGAVSVGTILTTSAPAKFAERDITLLLNEDGTLIVAWDAEELLFCRPWHHDPLRCRA